jgi:hypothetical protein
MKLSGVYDIKIIENGAVAQHVISKNSIPEGVLAGILKYAFSPSNFGTYDANLKCSYGFDAMTIMNYIPDLSGNNYPVPYISGSGNSIVSGGVYRNALRMNGATGSAKFYNSYSQTDALATAADWTIEGWIRTTTSVPAGQNPIVTYGSYSTYPKGLLFLSNNVPGLVTSNAGTAYNSIGSQFGAISLTNRWYHLAGVHSSTLGNTLFVDGVLVGINTAQTQGYTPTGTTYNGLGGYLMSGITVAAYLNGDIDNVAITTSSTKYVGNIIGVKYFDPPVLPHTRCRCYGDNISTNSNYRPVSLILCNNVVAPTKFDGTFTDDYTQKGIWVRNGSYNYYAVDLNSAVDESTLAVTIGNNSIKLTVTLPEHCAMGEWKSITIVDNCIATKTYLGNSGQDLENITYPIVSQLNLPSTVVKRRFAKMIIEWTVQLTQS